MKAISNIDRWVGRLRWLSVVLIVALLTTIGLPVALPTNLAQASPDSWTQSTYSDFYNGSEKNQVLVIDVGGGDGNVKLDYELTSSLKNWPGPTETPTPGSNAPARGKKWVAQTFTADADGSIKSIVLYLVKEGSPPELGNLVVELRNADSSGPGTTPLRSVTIPSSDITTVGGAYEIVFSSPFSISSGVMYAIVLHQVGDAGSTHNEYQWYYDDTPGYGTGQAWKSEKSGESWSGFGSHDFCFIINALTQYYTSGSLTSSAHDTGYSADFGTISWTADVPTGTTLKFQIRTASTEVGLSSATWHGPSPTEEYYTSSGTTINSVHDGDQYIKYKAYFETTDTSITPVLHDVTIIYSPANTAPVAVDDSASTDEDTSVDVDVLANDSDPDGDASIMSVSDPPNGTAVIDLNSTPADPSDDFVTYTPDLNYNGSDSFTYTLSDSIYTDTATVSITINAVNDLPVAVNDSASTDEDTPVTIDVLTNDSDADGDTLSVSGVSDPPHGSVAINSDNTVTYTPDADYNGSDSFTYTISDGNGGSDTATVSITVTAVNDAPVANDDSASTDEDTSVDIDVLANDFDPDGDTLAITLVSDPPHGTAVIDDNGTSGDPSDDFVTYTPDLNYNGPDGFNYTISDGTDTDTATGSVAINPVNDAPVAVNDSATVAEGGTVTVLDSTEASVLANDTDADLPPDTLTATKATDPAHGSLTLNSDGTFNYTHDGSETTSDSFTYKVNDGTADSNIATVSITVNPANDAPVADDQSVTTAEDTAKGITLIASDVDGDSLTWHIVSSPAHGTLTGTAPDVIYTPAADYNGPDSFTFKVNDGTVDSNIATVSITINPANDAPVADDQSVTTAEDTAKGITLIASDVDGDSLTWHIVSSPAHGTLTGTAPDVIYTPAADYNGPDSFTFKVNDGTVDSNIATVSITVNPANDAPVADDQSVTTAEDTAKGITLIASDVDGDSLTWHIVSSPAHGTLTGTAPDVIYTPAADYNGPDSFTFKVNDGTVDSNIATVSITINPVNDAPVADDQSVTTAEDTAKGITLTASDADGDSLTWHIVSSPSHGTLTGTAPDVTYTPAADYNGPDSFTFKVNDGTVDSNIATVSITINPVDDPVDAVDDDYSVNEDNTLTVAAPGVMSNDSAPDGGASVTLVSDVSDGTLSLNNDGSFTYTPDADYNGSDSFTYELSDTDDDTDQAIVSITVNPVSDGDGRVSRPSARTYFTVDFLGEITKEPMSKSSGKLLDTLEAPSPDGIHLLEIEEGTKTLDEDGEIVKLIEITEAKIPSLPENTVVVGSVYNFEPSNITFSQPIILTLGYDINELPDDVMSVSLAYYATLTGWVELEAEGDVVAELGRLAAPVEHFTLFAVLASVSPLPPPTPPPPPPLPAPVPPPAAFELSNLSLSSSFSKVWELLTFVVKAGEEVTITVDVANNGGQEGGYEALLKINGVTQATKEITLGAGQHQKITFTVTENEPGHYVVQIGDLSGEFQNVSWFNWWLTGGLVALLILLGWLAWYYLYYKKRQKYAS